MARPDAQGEAIPDDWLPLLDEELSRLPENYYGQFIRAAEQGGMAAICGMDPWKERIAANPANGPYLRDLPVQTFIDVLTKWKDIFVAGVHLPVMGVTEAELRSIKVPTIVVPGNDKTHSSESGLAAHRLIPGSTLLIRVAPARSSASAASTLPPCAAQSVCAISHTSVTPRFCCAMRSERSPMRSKSAAVISGRPGRGRARRPAARWGVRTAPSCRSSARVYQR